MKQSRSPRVLDYATGTLFVVSVVVVTDVATVVVVVVAVAVTFAVAVAVVDYVLSIDDEKTIGAREGACCSWSATRIPLR